MDPVGENTSSTITDVSSKQGESSELTQNPKSGGSFGTVSVPRELSHSCGLMELIKITIRYCVAMPYKEEKSCWDEDLYSNRIMIQNIRPNSTLNI